MGGCPVGWEVAISIHAIIGGFSPPGTSANSDSGIIAPFGVVSSYEGRPVLRIRIADRQCGGLPVLVTFDPEVLASDR
jgi:hypothetical protein